MNASNCMLNNIILGIEHISHSTIQSPFQHVRSPASSATPDIATVSVGGDEGMGQKISQVQVAL